MDVRAWAMASETASRVRGGSFSDEAFELGEELLDRIEVG
jgi:hypothetical protein